jgi:hypothetical protein
MGENHERTVVGFERSNDDLSGSKVSSDRPVNRLERLTDRALRLIDRPAG